MSSEEVLKPRGYQEKILKISNYHLGNGFNVLIELDCGLGKRFLQYSIIKQLEEKSKILLILQSSTSLYETADYLKKYLPISDLFLINNQIPSKIRNNKLREHRIILTLPQTLYNTIKKFPNTLDGFNFVILNEVDQLIKRLGSRTSLKHPYPKLLGHFENKTIIGMSGTLRDNHYILDQNQIKIKKELHTLMKFIGNTQLISMDMLEISDLNDYILNSQVIATAVEDERIKSISVQLDGMIEKAKKSLLNRLKNESPNLYHEIRRDYTKLFGPLPVESKIAQNLHHGYLVRKYLWSMPGETSYQHLISYGINGEYLKDYLPRVPAKFFAVRKLVKEFNKSVVLCSYLDTVDTLEQLIISSGIETVKITGNTAQRNRNTKLNLFRNSSKQMVAILSNVGERDLDIPEAELLVIFDLVRTVKTVYQKLKRSRGGECRILYYNETREELKVNSVLEKISEKYNWSTQILNPEKILL